MLWEGEVSRGDFWKWFYLPTWTTCTWAHHGKKGSTSTCEGSNKDGTCNKNSSSYPYWHIVPCGELPFTPDWVFAIETWLNMYISGLPGRSWKHPRNKWTLCMWAMSLAVSWASVESPLCFQRSLNFQQFLSKCSNSGTPLSREGFKKWSLKEFHADPLLV